MDWHHRQLAILQAQLGEHHPIVQLVTKGLSDDPDQRPEAKELVCQLELLVENLVCSHILNELSYISQVLLLGTQCFLKPFRVQFTKFTN